MFNRPLTITDKDYDPRYDKVCNGFGCSNKAIRKVNINAGTFGLISLNLCSKCIRLFTNQEVSKNG